jgi:probable rRNA maturation factor
VAGLEVEVIGVESVADAPATARMRRLCTVAAAVGGVQAGHVAIEFVDAERIAALNAEHRGKREATDVLSFPIDGAGALGGLPRELDGQLRGLDGPPRGLDGPLRELGDVLICPEHTVDLCEAVVHGVLHLVGMDHETDAGEMLAVQAEILRWEQIDPQEGMSKRQEGRPTQQEHSAQQKPTQAKRPA